MAKDRNLLLDDLINKTESFIKQVEAFNTNEIERLNAKPSNESWSVLECIEHLNLYGRFYIPEITARLKSASPSKNNSFEPGRLGNYFAKAMRPSPKMKAIKTFKSMNPNGSLLDSTTLDEFVNQQNDILKLLIQARQVDLAKTKTSISISRFIKLRLGDTLRVLVFHNLRHIEQAKRTLILMTKS